MGMVDAADRGATERIVLWENKSGRAMVVLEAGGERRRIATKVQWSRLEAFRDKLVERLYQAVRATGGVRQQDDWDRIREAVGLLDEAPQPTRVFRRGTVTPDRLPKATRQIDNFGSLINGICAARRGHYSKPIEFWNELMKPHYFNHRFE
jgi:hypothetical protein